MARAGALDTRPLQEIERDYKVHLTISEPERAKVVDELARAMKEGHMHVSLLVLVRYAAGDYTHVSDYPAYLQHFQSYRFGELRTITHEELSVSLLEDGDEEYKTFACLINFLERTFYRWYVTRRAVHVTLKPAATFFARLADSLNGRQARQRTLTEYRLVVDFSISDFYNSRVLNARRFATVKGAAAATAVAAAAAPVPVHVSPAAAPLARSSSSSMLAAPITSKSHESSSSSSSSTFSDGDDDIILSSQHTLEEKEERETLRMPSASPSRSEHSLSLSHSRSRSENGSEKKTHIVVDTRGAKHTKAVTTKHVRKSGVSSSKK